MLKTGVDMIEIERIRQAVERHGARFLQRIFTAAELRICDGRMPSYAARFAAKEALAKALGTGVWRHGIDWTDLEIGRDESSGEPIPRLHNRAAERMAELGLSEIAVSLSHDRGRAIAVVVAH